MTEEELMKTMCPHQERDVRGNYRRCIGAACSQYREKPADAAKANRMFAWKNDPTPDPNVWTSAGGTVSGMYFKRIVPITRTNAWCGLAGVPPHAEL